MKTLSLILAGAAIALTGATAATARPSLTERNEARLERMLEGRVAGEPVQCISAMRSNSLQVIEHVGLVYDAGDTIYVARASDPRQLGISDVPIIDRQGSQLCTFDVRQTVDRSHGHITGAVFLDDFVPYTKAG
jgi:hypothetical protein